MVFGRTRPNLYRRRMLHRFRPASSTFIRILPGIGQSWPTSTNFGSMLTRFGPAGRVAERWLSWNDGWAKSRSRRLLRWREAVDILPLFSSFVPSYVLSLSCYFIILICPSYFSVCSLFVLCRRLCFVLESKHGRRRAEGTREVGRAGAPEFGGSPGTKRTPWETRSGGGYWTRQSRCQLLGRKPAQCFILSRALLTLKPTGRWFLRNHCWVGLRGLCSSITRTDCSPSGLQPRDS